MLRCRIQRPGIFEAKGIYRNLDEFDNGAQEARLQFARPLDSQESVGGAANTEIAIHLSAA
jgi:hypothetical protein